MGTYIFVQHPASGKDERNVGNHVDHGGPVDPDGANTVVLHDDIGDDRVLDPLHGVGGRVQYEDGQN